MFRSRPSAFVSVIVVVGATLWLGKEKERERDSQGPPRAVPTLAAGPSVGSIKIMESSRLGATCH